MENTGFTTIQDWMLNLPLSYREIAIYAIIYGFSQDGETRFEGSLGYLARKTKSTKNTARSALRKLMDEGLIEQGTISRYGVEFHTYRVISTGGSKIGVGVQKLEQGGVKIAPNNIEDNIDINICSNKKAAFVKPTLYDVQIYCAERGNTIDPQAFIDFYESNGWMVGKNRMKDWKAAIRTWESRNATRPKAQQPVKKQSNLERLNAMAAEIMGGFKL